MKSYLKYLGIRKRIDRIKYLKENNCPQIILDNEERLLKELIDKEVEKPQYVLFRMYVLFEEKMSKSGLPYPHFKTEIKALAYGDSKKEIKKELKKWIKDNNELTTTNYVICNVNDLSDELADVLYKKEIIENEL